MRRRKAKEGSRSRQLGVFSFRLLENRDVWVGIFPSCKKVLVADLAFILSPASSKVRANWRRAAASTGSPAANPAWANSLKNSAAASGKMAMFIYMVK